MTVMEILAVCARSPTVIIGSDLIGEDQVICRNVRLLHKEGYLDLFGRITPWGLDKLANTRHSHAASLAFAKLLTGRRYFLLGDVLVFSDGQGRVCSRAMSKFFTTSGVVVPDASGHWVLNDHHRHHIGH